MDYIIGDRGTGKTQELIEKAAETGARIVCANIRELDAIRQTAKEQGLNIKTPWTVSDFLSAKSAGNNDPVLIDNLENVLRRVFPIGHEILAITIGVDINHADSLEIHQSVRREK